jgi:hypothetical protein
MNNPMSPEDIAKHTKKLKALGILKINKKNGTFEIDFQKLEAAFEKLGKNKKLNTLVKSKKTKMSMESASRKSASSSKKTSIHTGGANITTIGNLRGLDPMGTCSVEPWELELQTNIDAYMKNDYLDNAAESTIVQMYKVVEDNPVLTVGVVVGVLATLGYQKLKSPTAKMIKKAHKKFKDTCESAPRFIRGLYFRALEYMGRQAFKARERVVEKLGGVIPEDEKRGRNFINTNRVSVVGALNPQQKWDAQQFNLGNMEGSKLTRFSSTPEEGEERGESSSSQGGGGRKKATKKRVSKKAKKRVSKKATKKRTYKKK